MSHAPHIFEFQGVSKRYFNFPVLSDIDLSLGQGRILGLVGENGAGKSTLMNILGGVVQPSSGRMLLGGMPYAPADPRHAARSGVAFIHQELNLFPNLSVAENLHADAFPRLSLGRLRLPFVDRRRMHLHARQLLEAVDLDCPPDQPVARLAPGQRQLVEIARAMGAQARIVMLDEPTSSLTTHESQRLFDLMNRLRGRGTSMIYISHRLDEVLALCDDIAVLRDGRLVSVGPRSQYHRDRLVREMVGREVADSPAQRRPASPGAVVLRAERLNRSPAVRDVSFTISEGEVVGLFGLVGAGRTELARLLFGLDAMESGRIWLRGARLYPSPRGCIHRGMALLTENRRDEGLLLDENVEANAALATLPRFARPVFRWIHRRALRHAVKRVTEQVRLAGVDPSRQSVRTLSGGNQQKVVLAKWLLCEPRLFILDEPTRGIDVGARQEVYRLIESLSGRGAAIVVISSEIEELLLTCDRILVMAGGRIRDELRRDEFDRERILHASLAMGEVA